MSGYDELTFFAIACIFLWSMLVVNGYMKGRRHLFSMFNFFLIGSIEFVGISMLALSRRWLVPFNEYRLGETRALMAGVFIFYAATFLFYFASRAPRRLAGTHLLKWPRLNPQGLVVFSIVSVLLSLFFFMPLSIPFFGEVLRMAGNKAIAFAIVLVFMAWYCDKKNILLFYLLAAIVLYSLLFSIMVGGGRRTFVSTIIGIPIALYWVQFRKSQCLQTILIYGLIGGFILTAVVAYGSIRHRGRQERLQRDVAYSADSLSLLGERFFEGDLTQLLGQRSVEYSLIAGRVYKRRPQPFAALKYVLSAPIPRSVWPDKPIGLGYHLPKDAHAKTRATWGAGIVGHAFHEGSLLVLVLYGAIMGLFLRICDEFLTRQPDNPFMIGTMVSIAPHVAGWVRGDIGTFTNQILAGIVAAAILVFVVRCFVRSTVAYRPTPELSIRQLIALERRAFAGATELSPNTRLMSAV